MTEAMDQGIHSLYMLYRRKVEHTSLGFIRYLYSEINWSNRLIAIKGAKGVGKTTLMLQHIKMAFEGRYDKALYVSMDHIWFMDHSLLELAEYFYAHGGTHLFLDEAHKYPNWAREVKNVYDYYPELNIVLTGSSMLRLETEISADLSRRHRGYTLQGLSFREYLQMEGVLEHRALSLGEILSDHSSIAVSIASKLKVLPYFEQYARHGYYPFYKEEGDGFGERLQSVINNIVEAEIPSISNIEYSSVYKIKRLLSALAQQSPFTLNVTSLCKTLGVTRNTLLKLIDLVDKAALIRLLYASDGDINSITKPEKILFDNTNIAYAYMPVCNAGTVRETFAASQLAQGHKVCMPDSGDILVDGKHLFEVGGKKKGFKQIKGINDSYVLSDNIEIGVFNKIPLWLLGFLY